MRKTKVGTVPNRRLARARAMTLAAVVTLGTSLAVSTEAAFAEPVVPAAPALPTTCAPSPVLINTGYNTLVSYSTSGVMLDVVDVPRAYGDIAMTASGALYGINYPSGPPTLYTIDPATGAETASLALTGAVLNPANISQTTPTFNSLSALPNGDLLIGAASVSTIFRVNPTTGVTTVFGASFPAGVTAAGDFLSLPNGDLLAVGSAGGVSPLFLVHPNSSVTQIGTVPKTFGAAQSAGVIYLAGETGDIMRLDSLPTVASTAPLPYTTIAKTGRNFYGATSVGDAGVCSPMEVRKSVDVGTTTAVNAGQTVTYTLTFDNSRGATAVSTFFTDDLTKVVDDARVTTAPTLASGTGLTVGTVSTSAGITTFPINGVLAAGATATVTYSVTVDNPGTGDRVMTNYVIPTGEAPPLACVPGNAACTTNPVVAPVLQPRTPAALAPKLTLRKTANRTRVKPGQTIQYRLTAQNTGNGAAEHVMLCDDLPDHLTLVTAKKQLAKVQAKVTRGKLCWTIGTLKPGKRIVRSFTVRVDRDTKTGRIVNRATLDRTNVPGTDAKAQRTVKVQRVKPRVSTSKVTG